MVGLNTKNKKYFFKKIIIITNLFLLFGFATICFGAENTCGTPQAPGTEGWSCRFCKETNCQGCVSNKCLGASGAPDSDQYEYTRCCPPTGNGGGGGNIIPTGINNAGSIMGAVAGGIGYGSGNVDLPTVIGNIIKTILSFIGILFLILIIVSGIQWMTAGGNEDTVKKSKARIKNAIFGLAITIFAYAITYFIIDLFFESQI